MAKQVKKSGKKASGKPFEKGQAPGPGRPRLSEDLKVLRMAHYHDMVSIVIWLESMNYNEMMKMSLNGLSTIETIIVKAYRKNNMKVVEYLHNRVYGKCTESHRIVDFNGDDRTPTLIISDVFLPEGFKKGNCNQGCGKINSQET